jgi:flagellar biosynthetic protein FliO
MNKKYRIFLLSAITLLLIMVLLVLPKFGRVAAVPNQNESSVGAVVTPSDGNKLAETDTGKVKMESLTMSMAKLMGALFVVVVGIYGFLYLLRRMMGSKLSANRNSRLIEVLETTFVAQKKSVSLVRFGDRAVLLGITDGNMTPLAELSAEETVKILAESTMEKSAPGFKNILQDARGKWRALTIKRAASEIAAIDLKRPETV